MLIIPNSQESDKQDRSTKVVAVRLNETDLAALNQRFHLDGFKSLSDVVRGYLDGEIRRAGRTDQVEKLFLRLKEKNITDPLTGEITPTFYKNTDIEDFRHYLKSKYKYSRYPDSLVSYYQRLAEFFFTKQEIIRAESGRVRAWICDTMRRYGEYYDFRFQNPEMRLLVKEIIERYEINRNMTTHDKLWLADQNYLDNSITKILATFNKGDLGTLIRFALFTGQKHCYFTILPTKLWQEFRALPQADYEIREFAHQQLKNATNGEVALMDLRKFNYNINVRSEMKELGAEVLAGRAKTVSARHYLLNELDLLAEQYARAWKKYL